MWDIQVKAEYHGTNLVIAHDSSCTFKVPTRYMKLIQEISVIVHWVYKSQQTAFDISDIDLETTAGLHLLKEVKIWKGIPTASTYLNSAPWHPNQKPPPKLLTKIRTTQRTHLVQTTKPLRCYLQRSEQHSAHIWCKPITPFEVTYKDEKNIVHTPIYRL